MKTKTTVWILCVLSHFIGILAADEPSWTPAERTKLRDAMVTGSVTKVTDLGEIDTHSRLVSAEITIVDVHKPHKDLPRTKVTLYYVGSNNGSRRCPRFPELNVGQKGQFYLQRGDWLTKKPDFILSIGSDFIVAPSSAAKKLASAKTQKNLL